MSATVTHAETYNFVAKWGSYAISDGQFSTPIGVAVDSSGNVYVADSSNNRIQKFDSSGTFITKWGSIGDGQFSGSGDGQFYSPEGVAVDSSGNVYVTDTNNHRIQKFDSNGTFITKWGSQNSSGNGQFDYLVGIAVDSSGNVYVTDANNHRIQKFDSSGTFITKWGSRGIGDGQFDYPWGIAVDSSGNVYVVDLYNHRIQKFDSSGTFITKWGSFGKGDGQFNSLRGIAVDSSGNVYVADSSNNRVQKFAKEGKIIPTVTWNNPADIVYGTPLSSTQLNAIASVPGTFFYTPAEGTILNIGTQTLHVDFTPDDTVNYNIASADVIINVIIPPPTINSIAVPLDTVPVGTSIENSADVTYLGDFDTLTAEWNWGDGNTSEPRVSSNFAASHVYDSAGVYTIIFTLKDQNGGIYTQTSPNCVVVYDPQGGFVTGGGWINSPAGAYVPDNTLAGKATFGFVSKYEKGATVPTGKTEFQFKAADLNFHSENYDWLVVAGPQAKYKGTGTINGEGNYGLMLSAVDGAIKGDGIDKFRIKIWDKESGNTIYDNEIGTGEDAELSTVIGGGSVIIHKEK